MEGRLLKSTITNIEGVLTLTAKTRLPRRWYALEGQNKISYETKLKKAVYLNGNFSFCVFLFPKLEYSLHPIQSYFVTNKYLSERSQNVNVIY